MRIRCPECGAPLDADLRCDKGHTFPLRDGVPSLIGRELRAVLDPFLDAFSKHRRELGATIDDPMLLAGLPASGLALAPELWRVRMLDLALVLAAIGARKGLRILDVGAWNGWLSHRLAAEGHQVVAIDYFTDPGDGLGAVKDHPVHFDAYQFDLERLDLLEGPFDLVIANRCMAYFLDLSRSVAQLRRLLSPNATLLITGLNAYRDAAHIAGEFARKRAQFQATHGLPYFFKPVRGYLTDDDLDVLREAGVQVRGYAALRWKNALWPLRPGKPRYFYGVLRATGSGR